MKRFSISTMLWSLLLLLVYSCEDLGIQPVTEETATPLDITSVGSDMALVNNDNGNKIVLYLKYLKNSEKIEVNRHQATLNFDNHDPQIVDIYLQKNEEMVNLKNFRAEYNLLTEIPTVALSKGIKRIETAHNRLKILPDLRKRKISTLKLLDISYNNLKKVNHKDLINLSLQSGAILNLTKTGISCDEIKKYLKINLKNNLEVIVIYDCDKKISPTPIPIEK